MDGKMNIFKFKIDDEISNIFFFTGNNKSIKTNEILDNDDILNKPKNFLKKNYLYITKNGEIKFKNLGVKKKSASQLTRRIFNETIVPEIKENKKVKFSKTFFKNHIQKLLNDDIKNASMRYKVKPVDAYKSSSQIQCQISERYGPGIHFLISNKKIGIGIGKKYCTIEEFEKNNLRLADIDLSGIYKELEYFTIKQQSVNLGVFL